MIKIQHPELDVDYVYSTCISRVRSTELKSRLVAIKQEIIDQSEYFEALAKSKSFYQFARNNIVGGNVTTGEMEKVYKDRMAKKGAPGREIYDEIKSLAPYGKCPLCVHRAVTTLDHYLPKTHYPVLAVTPLNLVPACSDCNKSKLTDYPKTIDEQTLHPYFDDIGGDYWLNAEVQPSKPATVIFNVMTPYNWSETTKNRVNLHFTTLGLASLYSAQAADELLNIRYQLGLIYDAGGAIAVKSELESRATSCRQHNINSWRTATFDAFSKSDWFCNGGFRDI
jgi:5-methylcytosine-specific restriction endonuclease McrA